MKELITSIITLFPEVTEYNILCSKEIYTKFLKILNSQIANNSDFQGILIKSFEKDGKTFNIREGLSIEKGFKVEF